MTYRTKGIFATTLVFLMLFLMIVAAGAAWADIDDDPQKQRAERLKHRVEEAEGKEKSTKALLMADAQKTANQALYDVHHYDLNLTVNSSSKNLIGVVTTTAEVIGASLSTMELHLVAGMNVSAVTSGGMPSTFSRSGDILTVSLGGTYVTGETIEVGVSYNGNPAGDAFVWSSYNSAAMTYTHSEPYGSRDWWPCKDLNTDKADSVDLRVTVISSEVVASNGLLQSDVVDGLWRTFHWKTNYPTATYLVSLAIYPYHQYSDWYTPLAGGDPMEVQFFTYLPPSTTIATNYAETVLMIGAFADAYGEYPFVDEKYGHAQFTWGGGMEHQTLSSMGSSSPDLISHELAHQWWGDMVTCADFGHIWLNEGFATWSEAYWIEQKYGALYYHNNMSYGAYFGAGTVFVEDPLTETIFDVNLSYNKGSWVVHMLRGALGEVDFFAGLELYRAQNQYGSATTEDLQAAMEVVSGRDLTAFFQQWVYGEYYPVYELSWAAGPGAGEVSVTLNQAQINTGVFVMPVTLRITTDLGVVDVRVENDQLSQDFVIPVTGIVESVFVDPDNWILSEKQTVVAAATLDQGVLLVNGVSWADYGAEATAPYLAQAYWGNTPITFWDTFDEPVGGYPATLPAPQGHGSVPAAIISQYSTVIWVGNNYAGDLAAWTETPIKSYLEAGGNVLLMTRLAHSFLTDGLDDYLGVGLAENETSIGNCIAMAPGLVDIPLTGTQNLIGLFTIFLGPETTKLFTDTAIWGGGRVTGVISTPAAGGTFRDDGGRFAVISARPYRMDASALSTNVEYLLANHMLEPYNPPVSAVGDDLVPVRTVLGANYPNPFNPQTIIPFSVARAGVVELNVYDARGHLVRHLAAGEYAAGEHKVQWDGADEQGRSLPSGTYFARLRDGSGEVQTSGLVLVR